MSATAPIPKGALDSRLRHDADYYIVFGSCGNCAWAGPIMVELGIPAPKDVTCLVCAREEVDAKDSDA